MSKLIYLLLVLFSLAAAARTEGDFCYNCSRTHHSRHRGGGTQRCPSLEPLIATMAPGQVACYSSLFFVESTCQVNVIHSQKKTHNPHPGVGLCAIETSPVLRKARGPACAQIGSAAGQIRCCISMMRSTGGVTLGQFQSGKTPRCG